MRTNSLVKHLNNRNLYDSLPTDLKREIRSYNEQETIQIIKILSFMPDDDVLVFLNDTNSKPSPEEDLPQHQTPRRTTTRSSSKKKNRGGFWGKMKGMIGNIIPDFDTEGIQEWIVNKKFIIGGVILVTVIIAGVIIAIPKGEKMPSTNIFDTPPEEQTEDWPGEEEDWLDEEEKPREEKPVFNSQAKIDPPSNPWVGTSQWVIKSMYILLSVGLIIDTIQKTIRKNNQRNIPTIKIVFTWIAPLMAIATFISIAFYNEGLVNFIMTTLNKNEPIILERVTHAVLGIIFALFLLTLSFIFAGGDSSYPGWALGMIAVYYLNTPDKNRGLFSFLMQLSKESGVYNLVETFRGMSIKTEAITLSIAIYIILAACCFLYLADIAKWLRRNENPSIAGLCIGTIGGVGAWILQSFLGLGWMMGLVGLLFAGSLIVSFVSDEESIDEGINMALFLLVLITTATATPVL